MTVTVITGSRKGIGRHLAEHFLEKGHFVFGCARKPSDLHHDRYFHAELDVADEERVVEFFEAIRDRFGKVDNLINNAGIGSLNHSLLTPASTAKKILDTNVLGTFLCCREAARLMKPRNFGRIVNFSSAAVRLKPEGEALYAASKAAVEMLTMVLAKEFGPFGITVNAVGPSVMETDLTKAVPPEKIAAILRQQAIPRPGTMDEVAKAVDFFLDPENGGVTGQVSYLATHSI